MRTSKVAWVIVGAVGVVFLLQVGYAWWVFQEFPNRMATRGQFGDLFGAVNAFFTGLAFAGVVFTIFLQRKELEETTALSVIAALVNSYTSRIDTMEQGESREKLWAANKVITDAIPSWDEKVCETSGGKKAMRDKIKKSVDNFIDKHPESSKLEWVRNEQNRRDFVAWVYVRCRRNHFLAILEDEFERSVSGQGVTREYKGTSAPDT